MSKFTESIKGFVNNHFTKEVTCAHCGETGKVMFYSAMQDGNMLCSACKNKIPEQFKFKAKESTLAQYERLHNFMQHTKNDLEPIFCPTEEYSYGSFKVDAQNNLCRIGNSFVFEISNILAYSFCFKAEEFKDGIFRSKVKGDVHMCGLILREPFASFEDTVIKHGAKGKAEKRAFSSTVLYENPREMDEFVANFDSLWEKFEEERKEKELQALVEQRAKEMLAEKVHNND